jgi:hypothetical protein
MHDFDAHYNQSVQIKLYICATINISKQMIRTHLTLEICQGILYHLDCGRTLMKQESFLTIYPIALPKFDRLRIRGKPERGSK